MNKYQRIEKIARRITAGDIDTKLFWAKSKQTAKNIIYRNVQTLIKGIFRDDDWRYVNRVFDRLRRLGLQVVVTVKNGGYFEDRRTHKTAGKKYDFTLSYVNIQGKTFKFDGQLICSFCGSVNDPTQAYDISLIIY